MSMTDEIDASGALIPYPSGREIVLRHKDSVVVYDPASKQLVVQNVVPEDKLASRECPYCHRPIGDENEGGNDEAVPPDTTANFASPEYFRMLQESLPGSKEPSPPPSPQRRLTQSRLRSGFSTPQRLPHEAEFVRSSPVPSGAPGISTRAFSQNYFKNFFIEERELGRGGKGVVLLVKHVLDGVSLGHFALKRIPVGDDHQWLEKVLIEVQLLQHLSHQNLVSYRHVWLEDVKLSTFGPSVPCAFVLQQYCNGGDLHNYIFKNVQTKVTTEAMKERMRRISKHEPEPPSIQLNPRKLSFDEIYSFFKDITSGLNHLHVNGYIHRDLKPSNCLLHDNGNGLRVLVSDFGEVQAESAPRNSTGATGTISYCAPEVLRTDPQTGKLGNFSTKSDVFSLGMILYFLCFAQLPYRFSDALNEEDEDVAQLKEEIATWAGLENEHSKRPDLPERLYSSMQRLLSVETENRPSAEAILHTIKTRSSLDEVKEGRARSPGLVFEDLRPEPRISVMDSPVPEFVAKEPTKSRSPTRLRRLSPPENIHLTTMSSFQKISSTMEDESELARSPGGSLVLRSRHNSPIKEFPLPLPAPPHSIPRIRFWASPETVRSIKIAALLVKIISMYYPCLPLAAGPTTGIPILALASLDLLFNFGAYSTVILMALHIILLTAASRWAVLCVSKVSLWEEI